MSPDQPWTYKHQLTADEFIFVFTAIEADFTLRADEMRGKGVERLTGEESQRRYNVHTGHETKNELFTCINETKIQADTDGRISLLNIQQRVPDLVLRQCSLPPLTINKCTLTEVTDGNVTDDRTSFILNESTTRSFSIVEASTTGDFRIYGASTTGSFEIDRVSTTGDFWIEDKSTTGHFSIYGASTTGHFRIDNKSTTGDFRISGSQCAGFTASDLYASFYLQAATIPQFRLTSCHIPTLEISSGCKLEAYLANCTINLIDLRHLTLSKDSVVSLFGCQAYACLMEEFAILGQFYLRQLTPLSEPFAWFDPAIRDGEKPNEAKMKLLQWYTEAYAEHRQTLTGNGYKQLNLKKSTFRIVQSSLGKTEFTNCDLGGFQFEFNNAKITEVFMSGGTVPQKNIVIYGEESGSLAWEEQKVLVYNQLKKIFDGQGDIYWATTFQAKTAEHQEKVLELRKATDRSSSLSINGDLCTFRLNRISNSHGQSWSRALLFTLEAGVIFYILFLLSIGRIFLPTPIDWVLAGQYFQFLDPTHKIDTFVKNDGLNLGSYAADYIGRVFIGYGIFQFISAFRKHSKK